MTYLIKRIDDIFKYINESNDIQNNINDNIFTELKFLKCVLGFQIVFLGISIYQISKK